MERSREIVLILKGLRSEIKEVEEKIRRGEKILLNRSNGIKEKSPLSNEEIRERIIKLRQQLEVIDKEKFDFEFDVIS